MSSDKPDVASDSGSVTANHQLVDLLNAMFGDDYPCAICLEELEEEYRACPGCGCRFNGMNVNEYWDENLGGILHWHLSEMDSEPDWGRLAGEVRDIAGSNGTGDNFQKLRERIEGDKNQYLKNIENGHEIAPLSKFVLAMVGIDYRNHEYEEMVECKVCEKEFLNTQTQQHHISYLHDFTITVCYSCHRKIHHEDGYYDELQPDISRKEAKKLRETGYTSSDLEDYK